ncbi:MAG: hypothetical protein GXO71_02400 [Caldiserica bacterium]|nr:hypothetical protein [Caldisericota bacterium]
MLTYLSATLAFAETQNRKSVGLLLGDPIAISLKIPVQGKTFVDLRAGIWTWHFWQEQSYNTPYLSIDYTWNFPDFYAGIGIAFFFADNPKDERNYPACAAIRFPLGRELYSQENFSVLFELAPIYQVAPAYNFKPYIFELNGGLMLRHPF